MKTKAATLTNYKALITGKRLIGLHFGLMLFLLLNLAAGLIFGWQLNFRLAFGLKMILYLTAVVSFLVGWKNRSLLKYYTSLYIIAPLLVFGGFLLDGILGAVLGSVFLFFLYPPQTVSADRQFALKKEFAGFLGPCCEYGIYGQKFLLFEKKIITFNAGHPETEIIRFNVTPEKRALLQFKPGSGGPEQMLIKLP